MNTESYHLRDISSFSFINWPLKQQGAKMNILKLALVLVSVVAGLIITSCAKNASEDKSGPSVIMPTEKLNAIAQAQGAVGQFGNDLKSTKKNNALSAVHYASYFIALATAPNKTAANEYSKTVNEKSQKIYKTFQSAHCKSEFKSSPKQNGYEGDVFSLNIGGSTCPFKMSYTVDAKADSATNKVAGQMNMTFETMSDDVAKEIDLKKLAAQVTFAIANTMSPANDRFMTSVSVDSNSQGESISVGAYSTQLSTRLSSDMPTAANSNPSTSPGSSSNTSPDISVVADLNGSVVSGNEATSFLAKVQVAKGQIVTQSTKINGADVTEDQFNQVLSSLQLGFQANGGNTGTSASNNQNSKH